METASRPSVHLSESQTSLGRSIDNFRQRERERDEIVYSCPRLWKITIVARTYSSARASEREVHWKIVGSIDQIRGSPIRSVLLLENNGRTVALFTMPVGIGTRTTISKQVADVDYPQVSDSLLMELGFSGKARVSSKQWENIYLLRRDFVRNVLQTLCGQKKKCEWPRGVA